MNDYVQIAYKNNLDVHYILCECPNCERDNSRDEERMYQWCNKNPELTTKTKQQIKVAPVTPTIANIV